MSRWSPYRTPTDPSITVRYRPTFHWQPYRPATTTSSAGGNQPNA